MQICTSAKSYSCGKARRPKGDGPQKRRKGGCFESVPMSRAGLPVLPYGVFELDARQPSSTVVGLLVSDDLLHGVVYS